MLVYIRFVNNAKQNRGLIVIKAFPVRKQTCARNASLFHHLLFTLGRPSFF
jgi:hypothetical protein